MNYKFAAPLAAIGQHRLAHLPQQLATRAANAARILAALPEGGRLTELTHQRGDVPNYYNLVLTTTGPPGRVARRFAGAGLPPDSIRYGYRSLYHQPIFTPYARLCPNAEALATTTIQLPVHPGMTEAELQWVADTVTAAAEPESERQ